MKIAGGKCGSTASYQGFRVALTFEHQHSNQFILQSLWTFVPKYELIPSGHSWDALTIVKCNASGFRHRWGGGIKRINQN